MRTLRLLWLPICVCATVSGCKQGLGDRCELDSDCESGLTCSKGTARVCENPALAAPDASALDRDAPTIPDARFIPDGGPADARRSPDAAVINDAPVVDNDAPVVDTDAPPAPDAPPPDAAVLDAPTP
jgi:hypothetical protein